MGNSDIRKIRTFPLVESRSYGTNTYSACVTLGRLNRAYEDDKEGYGFVENDESETEVRSSDDQGPFQNVAAGDSIKFLGAYPTNDRHRKVSTRTDADNIVVNRAINLATEAVDGVASANFVQSEGYRFSYRTLDCGTDATDGWFPVEGWKAGNILLIGESESSATNGIDYTVEAYREGAASDVQILATGNLSQADIAAGGPDASVALGEFTFGTFGWTHIRLTVKVNGGSVVYSAYITLKE